MCGIFCLIKKDKLNEKEVIKENTIGESISQTIRRGFAFGLGTGGSIPFLDGIENIPDKYDTFQSRFDSTINYKYIIPKDYTTTMMVGGDEWSYTKLMHS